jgi:hypothetical protein
MQVVALTRITWMWLNKRGVSLIVLIIAITLMGLLGAGIASMIGSKQKSYPFQAHSYQAYTIAHAGIEFAIRYAYDNKDGFNGNPSAYIPSASPGKVMPFGDGTFELTYLTSNNGTLTSVGRFGTAKRTIELTNFRSYANIP